MLDKSIARLLRATPTLTALTVISLCGQARGVCVQGGPRRALHAAHALLAPALWVGSRVRGRLRSAALRRALRLGPLQRRGRVEHAARGARGRGVERGVERPSQPVNS